MSITTPQPQPQPPKQSLLDQPHGGCVPPAPPVQVARRIALDRLREHPMNANAMPAAMLGKLKRHIGSTGRYPPLIVRPAPDEADAYQVLDGHHRRLVLLELGHAQADCVVWDVDDEQALMLLATLNRLEGSDDPKRRAAIFNVLQSRGERGLSQLVRLMPDSPKRLARYAQLNDPPPRPRQPPALADMPTALTFQLTVDQRKRVLDGLNTIDPKPEIALLHLIDSLETQQEER